MTDHPPERFETERLILRRPHPTDAPGMFAAWTRDPEVTRYLVWRPHTTLDQTEAHIARCTAAWESGAAFTWLLERAGEPVGSIAARRNEHGINLGYLLARAAWGNGLMVEALDPVVGWFLARPDVYRVWATCDVDNHASARVLEKAGFTFEGILRQWDHHPNIGPGRRDARCYSRTRP